jgi:hypothetical protein
MIAPNAWRMQQIASILTASGRLIVFVATRLPWLCLILFTCVIPGCGDGRPQRVPVSGQVRIDGQPLKSGGIRFFPDDGRPSTGTIGPDGRFSLSTFEAHDGCTLGNHRVAVISIEELNSNTRRWNLPKIYSSPNTSKITQQIDGPIDSLKIDLTWGREKGPIIEKVYGD